jgi:hypothetical protein
MDWGSHILNGQIRTHRQNTVAIQEVVVEAGGSAENETGGAQLNYIPRDGGNRLNVYGFSNYTNENLQSENLSDDLKARGLTATPGVQTIWDHGIGVGGPIKEDRLWFYSSNRWWGGSEYQPGAYFNKTVGTLFYTPDLDRQVASTANWAKDFGGRLTYQATVKHKFTATAFEAAAATTREQIATQQATIDHQRSRRTDLQQEVTRIRKNLAAMSDQSLLKVMNQTKASGFLQSGLGYWLCWPSSPSIQVLNWSQSVVFYRDIVTRSHQEAPHVA